MNDPYTIPRLYDIAFDFRDVAQEVDFVLALADRFQQQRGRRPSALEFACGPAYHVREFARRGIVARGLDLSEPMVAYANQLILDESLDAKVIWGDMTAYHSEEKYDILLNLMSSFAHLLTNERILRHLDIAADLLHENGLYIIETAHPRDFFREEESGLKPYWTMMRGETTVVTSWGAGENSFDPITEIDDVIVKFTLIENGQSTDYEAPVKMRRLSMQTFRALVAQSGRFEIVELHGDMRADAPFDNSKSSPWLVAVLQKKA